MDQELAGKTALITGASRGIGAATAISLARNGVSRFVLHYNSNRQGIDKVLGQVRGLGAEGVAIQANLGQVAGFLIPVKDEKNNIMRGEFTYPPYFIDRATSKPAWMFEHGVLLVEEWGQGPPEVRRGLDNGRALQELLQQAAPRYIKALKRERAEVPKRKKS